jgi:hypothetical protein
VCRIAGEISDYKRNLKSWGDDVLRPREDDHDRTDCFRVARRRRSISQHTLPCVILVRFLKRFRMLSWSVTLCVCVCVSLSLSFSLARSVFVSF